MRPLQLDYLGHVETPETTDTLRYRLLRATSLTTYLDSAPKSFAVGLAGMSVFIGLVCGGLAAARIKGMADLHALAAFGGLLVVYSAASSVFGDGYVEASKHGISIGIGYALQISAAIGFVMRMTQRPARHSVEGTTPKAAARGRPLAGDPPRALLARMMLFAGHPNIPQTRPRSPVVR
jgi:hypothetical protein